MFAIDVRNKMLESSAQYVHSHLIAGSWKKSLSDETFDSWKRNLVLLELMAMRSIDRTAHFEAFIQAGFQSIRGVGHLTGLQKKVLDTLSRLSQELRLPETMHQIDAEVQRISRISVQNLSAQVEESHGHLFTAQVLDPSAAAQLKEISFAWCKQALCKASVAYALKSETISDAKRHQAIISAEVCTSLTSYMPSQPDSEDDAVYVAYDSTGKVHGIAMVSLREQKQQVYQIATNPENLVVHGSEKGVMRGAGSALIRHVCHDIMKSKRCATKLLKLRAVNSALSFYKGLGFEIVTDENADSAIVRMVLPKKKIARLSRTKPSSHDMLGESVSSEVARTFCA